jgi:malate dehydrogenase (oxaloacetate-decarboxylating)
MAIAPSASYSLTARLQIANRPGMLGRVASAIGEAGGDIGAVDLVESQRDRVVRDITINARDGAHGQQIVQRLRQDRTFLMHLGGKIEIRNKVPIRTRDDLSMVDTPGVARICLAIRDDRQRAFSLTMKQNSVAVVTDGTAVLGLGDIGPEAALPVMEGKAMLFKEYQPRGHRRPAVLRDRGAPAQGPQAAARGRDRGRRGGYRDDQNSPGQRCARYHRR